MHGYLSTACLHAVQDNRPELHGHCGNKIGFEGEKIPGQCKWCEARCTCECHPWNELVRSRPV